MLERKREGERWRRKKNSQGKLFALQCGLRGKLEREEEWERSREETLPLLYVLVFFFNSAFSRPEDIMASVLCTP